MPFPLNRLAALGWRYLLGAVVLLAFGAYLLFGRGSSFGPTLTIMRGDFAKKVSITGTVVPAHSVDLGFAANGRIAGTYAAVGQHVYEGQILAETENGDLVASIAQKQAALAEAEAKLASLRVGTRPEEIAVAQSAVESATAALVTALQSAYTSSDDAIRNRTDVLFNNPLTAPSLILSEPNIMLKPNIESARLDIEQTMKDWGTLLATLSSANAAASARTMQTYLAQVVQFLSDANAVVNQAVSDTTTSAATLSSYATSLATARANVNSAATTVAANLATLDSAQTNLVLKQAGSTGEDITAQQAAVTSAVADVKNAQAALAKTRVVAPFAGVVTRMDAKAGEVVSPSTSEISMQSDGLFQIETYVPEVSIADVHVGDLATTTLDAYGSSVIFAAKTVLVDPAETVKDGVPTYKTTLTFLAPNPRIRSGMTANVELVTGTLPDAVVIPSGAVGKSVSGSYVTVIEGGKTQNRPVEVGVTPSLGQIEIISGLASGDIVLLTPASP